MRRWLLCGGLDGSDKALKTLQNVVEDRRPDVVLFLGGILRPTEEQTKAVGKKDLTPEEARWYAGFFEALGAMDVFTALVPGRSDTPLREFLRLGMGAEIQNPNIHMAHATLAMESDFAICGVGGELTEWVDTGEHWVRVSRAAAEYSLRLLWRANQSRTAMMLGSPPSGPLGGTGEEGGIAGDLIDSYHPHLCAVAGSTEHRGTQQVASTRIVNPGRLSDASAAWFDWTQPAESQVEMLDLAHVVVTD